MKKEHAHVWRQLVIAGLVATLIVQGGWLLGPAPVKAVTQESGRQCVNVSAGRGAGIGACFLHDDIGFCAKVWTTDTTAVSACLLASSGGGNPRTAAKVQKKVIDTCYLDGYLALGVEIPVSNNMSWQRYDGSVGIELSFPDTSELAFNVETGVSLKHYRSWGHWYWRSESFVAVGVDLYF